MKYEEAMDWCEQFTDNLIAVNVDTNRRTLGLQAMQKCKEAIKKQIPQKPTPHKIDIDGGVKIGNVIWGKNTTAYRCPCCDELISRVYDYCYKCGQAIDWSE